MKLSKILLKTSITNKNKRGNKVFLSKTPRSTKEVRRDPLTNTAKEVEEMQGSIHKLQRDTKPIFLSQKIRNFQHLSHIHNAYYVLSY